MFTDYDTLQPDASRGETVPRAKFANWQPGETWEIAFSTGTKAGGKIGLSEAGGQPTQHHADLYELSPDGDVLVASADGMSIGWMVNIDPRLRRRGDIVLKPNTRYKIVATTQLPTSAFCDVLLRDAPKRRPER